MTVLSEQLSLWDKPKRKRVVKKRRIVGNILMLGGGRQSSGLVEMSAEGELPRFDLVLFADTGNEPGYVYDQVKYLGERLKLVNTPLITVRHKSGLSITDYMRHPEQFRFVKLPLYTKSSDGKVSQLPRQCTKEFKVEPCDLAIREWLLERGYAKHQANGLRVLPAYAVNIAFGFGADESYRVNRKPFTQEWKLKSFPLYELGITTAQLIEWFEHKGLPIPKKSSCKICPYHDDAYWLDMPPNDFEETCQFDDWLRTPEARKVLFRGVRDECYLHPSCVPLREVDFVNWRGKRRPVNPLQMELMLGPTCASDDDFSCMS